MREKSRNDAERAPSTEAPVSFSGGPSFINLTYNQVYGVPSGEKLKKSESQQRWPNGAPAYYRLVRTKRAGAPFNFGQLKCPIHVGPLFVSAYRKPSRETTCLARYYLFSPFYQPLFRNCCNKYSRDFRPKLICSSNIHFTPRLLLEKMMDTLITDYFLAKKSTNCCGRPAALIRTSFGCIYGLSIGSFFGCKIIFWLIVYFPSSYFEIKVIIKFNKIIT